MLAKACRPQVRDKLAEGAGNADPLAAGGHTIRDYQPAAVPVATSRPRGPDRDREVHTLALGSRSVFNIGRRTPWPILQRQLGKPRA